MNNSFEVDFFKYFSKLRDEMKIKFNRVLPSGELIFNRFEKAKYLNCGEGTSIYDSSVVFGDVEIGKNVWIGPFTILEGSNGKLRIGNFVSIASGVMIYTHDATKYYVSGGNDCFLKGDVTIGDFTAIGSMSIISCNVNVGKHCVIAANSYVNSNVSDFSIVAGNPARVIGKVQIDNDGKVNFNYD